MRTKSFTNLSKLSEKLPNGNEKKTGTLHKAGSEQNLISGSVTGGRSAAPRKQRMSSVSAGRQSTGAPTNCHKPLRTSVSTPNFRTSTVSVPDSIRKENLKNQNSSDCSQSGEYDCDKVKWITQWIEGVEGAEPERPETPIIHEDEPSQTDTAIHIVYGES